MSATLALELIRRAVVLALLVGAPLLLTALLTGLVVSLLQAITQVQEQTLTFIPKLVLMAVVFLLVMPWMLSQLLEYLVSVLRALPTLAT
jgi:flagellar biosynthetic protein FliQ